jgi:hypothetical protein
MTNKSPDHYKRLSSRLTNLLKKIDQVGGEVNYPRNWIAHPRIKQLYLDIIRLDTEIASGKARGQKVQNLQVEMNEAVMELKKTPEFAEFLEKQQELSGLWKEFNSIIMGE